MTASRSSPASRCSSAVAWPGRNVLMPSVRCPMPSSAPTLRGRPSASGGTGPSRLYAGGGRGGAGGSIAVARAVFLLRVFFTDAGSAGLDEEDRPLAPRRGAGLALAAAEVRAEALVRPAASFFLVVRGRLVVDIQCPCSLS